MSVKAWVGLLPWRIAIQKQVREELDWLTEAHLIHGSLRFVPKGILLTSEMLQDYPHLALHIKPYIIPYFVPQHLL